MTYIHKIIDLTTGEETEVPYTKEELAEVKARETEQAARIAEAEAKAAEKAALLAKLGITEDEARLLLG
jgi:hypothetical protein